MIHPRQSLYAAARYSLLGAALLFSVSCQTMVGPKQDTYAQPAYRPNNPSNVVVKVSLKEQMVYVMEGKRPLLITATCVGVPNHPTPKGHFTVYNKIKNKRSGLYGFAVNNSTGAARPAEVSWVHSGEHYVGHPMPYWVEFSPGYGFHTEYVWPEPHSHGCLRIHRNDAAKLFELARNGTPVIISETQPEDAVYLKGFKRPGPEHYLTPEPPPSVYISDSFFDNVPPARFEDSPKTAGL